jgi:hypothetical protein
VRREHHLEALNATNHGRRIQPVRTALLAFESHAATARQESELYVLPKSRLGEPDASADEETDYFVGREPLRVISLDASELVVGEGVAHARSPFGLLPPPSRSIDLLLAYASARSFEQIALYSTEKIVVNPSIGFFLCFSIMELMSRA